MPIVNSIQRLESFPYSNYTTQAGVALTTASLQTTTYNASSTPALGTQGYTNGIVRVHIYGLATGTTPTLASIVISVTDGTSTVTVGTFNPAVAVALSTTVAGSGVDWILRFNTDLNLTGV